jgi:hypothetical protein
MEKISIENIIKLLNELGKIARSVLLEKRNVNFKSSEWQFESSDYPNEWIYRNNKIKPFAFYYQDKDRLFTLSFYEKDKFLYLRIAFLNIKVYEKLFKNIINKNKFSPIVAKTFLKNGLNLSITTYKKLKKEHAEISENLQELTTAFENWVIGDNYTRAVKWGRQLDRLRPYMPEEAKNSPTHKLFRLIIVKQSTLDKVLNNEKPLMLKNRKYSSWTPSTRAANRFTKYRDLDSNQAYVILQKTFSDDEIIVNIPELMRYLHQKGKIDSYEYIEDEQEIIVKRIHDYEFTIKNIGLWKNSDTGKWMRPSL